MKASAFVDIPCSHSLHPRSAMMIATEVQKYRSDVRLSFGRRTVDARSILIVLLLAPLEAHKIKIVASGPDARKAVNALVRLFGSKRVACENLRGARQRPLSASKV